MPDERTNLKLATLFFLSALLLILFLVWVREISIEKQFIPTIMNGLTSSVSLIIAFSVASITLAYSTNSRSISILEFLPTLTFLLVPILILLISYFHLMNADYYVAFREALSSFIVAIMILIAYMTMVALRFHGERAAANSSANVNNITWA